MADTKMGIVESQFADMIWQNEPISTTELVKMAEKEFEDGELLNFTRNGLK